MEYTSRLLAIHRRINAHWSTSRHWHAVQHGTSVRWSDCWIHGPAGTGGRRWNITWHSHASYQCCAQSITWTAIATNAYSKQLYIQSHRSTTALHSVTPHSVTPLNNYTAFSHTAFSHTTQQLHCIQSHCIQSHHSTTTLHSVTPLNSGFLFSLLSAFATVFCDKVTLISTFYNNNNNNNNNNNLTAFSHTTHLQNRNAVLFSVVLQSTSYSDCPGHLH